MNIVEKKLNDIKPYEKNPRKNDSAVEQVANSIKEFGFKVPIVIDKNNVIVAGHTRYKADQERYKKRRAENDKFQNYEWYGRDRSGRIKVRKGMKGH